MNRIRLYFRRVLRRPAVMGPYRLYVRPTPTGALIDIEDVVTSMLITLADNPDLMGFLDEMARDRAESRAHDGWVPEGLYVEQLLGALGYEVPLYGDAVRRLADRLWAVAPAPAVVIPAQREGGAAA